MAAFTAVMIGLAVYGAASSAYSQHKAGQAAKAAGAKGKEASDDQAALSDYNAHIADLQAQDATERGYEQESRFRSQVRGAIGAQRAGFAGGNIDVGYGSAVDVQGDAAFLGELDALAVRHNAAREAWGFGVQAEDLRKRAVIQRKEGANLLEAGRQHASAANYQALGTIVGGAGSLLQSRYGFSQRSAG